MNGKLPQRLLQLERAIIVEDNMGGDLSVINSDDGAIFTIKL